MSGALSDFLMLVAQLIGLGVAAFFAGAGLATLWDIIEQRAQRRRYLDSLPPVPPPQPPEPDPRRKTTVATDDGDRWGRA